jgi:hypothetical protein
VDEGVWQLENKIATFCGLAVKSEIVKPKGRMHLKNEPTPLISDQAQKTPNKTGFFSWRLLHTLLIPNFTAKGSLLLKTQNNYAMALPRARVHLFITIRGI